MSAATDPVHHAYEAFGKGDIPALLDLLTDDVLWRSPLTLPHGGTFNGREGALQFFTGIAANWDNLTVAVDGVGELGGGVVAGAVTATGSRNGSAVDYSAVHLFTVANGKISSFREYLDLDGPLD